MSLWITSIVTGMLLFEAGVAAMEYKRVCYFTNWAQYRNGIAKFMADKVDPFLCTHVIYAFAKVVGNTIEPYEWNDINEWGPGQYDMIRKVRGKNPSLKILLAIGGWNHGSQPFTEMVKTQESIDEFANNSLHFLRTNSFDGLDLDWEYPANRGSPPEDKERFTTLCKTLRSKFDNEVLTPGKTRLLLTAAVAAGQSTVETAYEINKISLYLDFINLMAYDLFSDYNTITQHNSPLYKSLAPNTAFNVDFAVRLWLNGGCPAQKLILGMAQYGRSYKLQTPSEHGLGASTNGPGTAGTYTRENGFLSYYEVCDKIQNSGWSEKWLEDQKVPYAFYGDQWVGYDNIRSIEIKSKYIIQKGLGGGMFWAVDLDDFHGNCGHGKNPLMTTMKNVFNGAPPPTFSPLPSTLSSGNSGSGDGTGSTSSTGLTSKGPGSGSTGGDNSGDGSSGNPNGNLPAKQALGIECSNDASVVGAVLGIFLTIALATIIALILYILMLKGYDLPNFFQRKDKSQDRKRPMPFTDITRQSSPNRMGSFDDGGFNSTTYTKENRFHDNSHLPAPPVVPPPRFPPLNDHATDYCSDSNIRVFENPSNNSDEYSDVSKHPTYSNMATDPIVLSKSGRLGTATNV